MYNTLPNTGGGRTIICVTVLDVTLANEVQTGITASQSADALAVSLTAQACNPASEVWTPFMLIGFVILNL